MQIAKTRHSPLETAGRSSLPICLSGIISETLSRTQEPRVLTNPLAFSYAAVRQVGSSQAHVPIQPLSRFRRVLPPLDGRRRFRCTL